MNDQRFARIKERLARRQHDLTVCREPLIGQQKTGMTPEALADHQMIIPITGMVQWLNVTVTSYAGLPYPHIPSQGKTGPYCEGWEYMQATGRKK